MYKFPARPNELKQRGCTGKLKINRGQELGKGSKGNRVYKGTFEGREVAIKQMLCESLQIEKKLIDEDNPLEGAKEARLLLKLNHANVLRYHMIDNDEELLFAYMAVELCDGSLFNLIERTPSHEEKFSHLYSNRNGSIKSVYKKALLQDVLQGLTYLHSEDIIHFDIKPHNILLRKVKGRRPALGDLNFEAVLADFGLGLEIKEGREYATATGNIIGSLGWRAKELLVMMEDENTSENNVKGTKEMDIFSFGCLMQYIMIDRSVMKKFNTHPFGTGDYQTINNIMDENRLAFISGAAKYRKSEKLSLDIDFILADMLVHLCVSSMDNGRLRPKTQEIAKHPFFWDEGAKTRFVESVFNYINAHLPKEDMSNEAVEAAQQNKESKVVYLLIKDLQEKWRKYWNKRGFDGEISEAYECYTHHNDGKECNTTYLMNFLRIMRNMHQHYGVYETKKGPKSVELYETLREKLGPGTDEDFSRYFLHRVPVVLPVVYLCFSRLYPRVETAYKDYYVIDESQDGIKAFKKKIEIQWTLLDKILVETFGRPRSGTR